MSTEPSEPTPTATIAGNIFPAGYFDISSPVVSADIAREIIAAKDAEINRLFEGIRTIRSATHASDGTRLMNVGGMLIQNLCDQILP